MKKLIVFPLILALLVGLTGCSKGISFYIGAVQNTTTKEMTASYKLFNGTKDTKLTVKEGETVDIAVDITTKDGTIDAYIYKDKDDYNYEGKDIPTSSFTVTLSEPGEYTIKVDASYHKGGFSFKWD